MGKSYKNEKSFGPKRKRSPGGHYNPRREERQRIRRKSEQELDNVIDKYKNGFIDDPEDIESFFILAMLTFKQITSILKI